MAATDAQWAVLSGVFSTQGTRTVYKKGEYVVRPGDTRGNVYFIEQGYIKACDITKYGEENLLIIRQPHEIFPIIWAITGNEPHEIIYEALTTCTLWRLPRDILVEHLQQNPQSYVPMLDMVIGMYQAHNERIFTLEYRSVRERLVSFLLNTANRFGTTTERGRRIIIPLRHQDIASSINASRETTSREIAVLERQGLLTNDPGSIVLHDEAALHRML